MEKEREKEKENNNNYSLCIQCQGIGYIKHNDFYVKCVLCRGDLLIKKYTISKILGNCSWNNKI